MSRSIEPIVEDATNLVTEVLVGLAVEGNTFEKEVHILKYTSEVFAMASRILTSIVNNKKPPNIH